MNDGPGVAQRFGLANIRLEQEDAESSAWLDRHAREDGDTTPKVKRCKAKGCGKEAVTRGRCDPHYRKWLAKARES